MLFPDLEAYRIYSMRWAIEVCFAEMQGLLKLGKCQCRNFSSQIASISLTVMQYNILSSIKRFEASETMEDCSTKPPTELTERIWDLVLQIVAVIADLFSGCHQGAMYREENGLILLAKLEKYNIKNFTSRWKANLSASTTVILQSTMYLTMVSEFNCIFADN